MGNDLTIGAKNMDAMPSKRLIIILESGMDAVREQILRYAEERHGHHAAANSEIATKMTKDKYAEQILSNLDERLEAGYEAVSTDPRLIPPSIDKRLYMLTNYHHFLGEMKGMAFGYDSSKEIFNKLSEGK